MQTNKSSENLVKKILLEVSEEEFERWQSHAKKDNISLSKFIKNSVKNNIVRSKIIDYLETRPN
jgi:hypothetical protein